MKRSIGVTVFGILFLVGGALGLLSILMTPTMLRGLLESPGLAPEAQARIRAALEVFQSRVGIAAVQVVVSLAAGIGVLLLKRWAWWLALFLIGISIGQIGLSFVTAGGHDSELAVVEAGAAGVITVLVLLLSLAWNGFVLWFFLRPTVKAQFIKTVGRQQ